MRPGNGVDCSKKGEGEGITNMRPAAGEMDATVIPAEPADGFSAVFARGGGRR
jgi:hypothetical protein